jgi:hypothetical protein
MAKKKPSRKGQVKMIGVDELEELKAGHIHQADTEDLIEELKDRVMTPFEDLIGELESKKEEIEELKREIEDLVK